MLVRLFGDDLNGLEFSVVLIGLLVYSDFVFFSLSGLLIGLAVSPERLITFKSLCVPCVLH